MSADDALHVGANLLMTLTVLSVVLCSATMLASLNGRVNATNLKAVVSKVNSYAIYENRIVAGDKVQGFIANYGESLFIRVATEAYPAGFYGADALDARNVESPFYVNPRTDFYCTMLRDQNGDVIGLNFEQCGVTITKQGMQDAITYYNTLLGV